jgi:hypothetical protein
VGNSRVIQTWNGATQVPVFSRVERVGVGTLPVFLRTVHAAAFLDLGKAWKDDYASRGFARGAGFEPAGNLSQHEIGTWGFSGMRKSGIPDSVEMPAPDKAMA